MATRICLAFKYGKCSRGSECRFSHSLEEGDPQPQPPKSKDRLLIEWNNYIRQRQITPSRPPPNALKRFFPVALELMVGDVDRSQNVIKQLATDEGLFYIRDVADRCEACRITPNSDPEVWTHRVQPLFSLLMHPRVVDSAVLEEQVSTISNYVVGAGGRRLQQIYGFVTKLLKHWSPSTGNGSQMAAVELSLGALSALMNCNTMNKCMDIFRQIAQELEALSQKAVLGTDEFPRLQSRRYLEYIQQRVEAGQNLPRIEARPQNPAELVSFRLRPDLPGVLKKGGVARHDNDHHDITKIQIFPTDDEIQYTGSEYLPTNDPSTFHIPGIGGRLDREFRLLREDTVGQLRDAVRGQLKVLQTVESLPQKSAANAIRTHSYQNPIVKSIRVAQPTGLELTIQFSQPVPSTDLSYRRRWWEQTKRLQTDSLVCLLSDNGSACFLVVSQSTVLSSFPSHQAAAQAKFNTETPQKLKATLADDAELSFVKLNPVSSDSKDLKALLDWYRTGETCGRRSLVEFPGVLVPSFSHTLKALQRLSENPNLPFTKLLAPDRLENSVMQIDPPQYATKAGFSFDLGCLTKKGTRMTFSPRDHPDPQRLSGCSTLDHTQSTALLNSLSRGLSLIQGPPGTGKSYTGEKIVRVLLENKKEANLGPIVCVCYTNHALDQFLEHLLDDGEERIIRIGSKSKSEKLKQLNLHEVSKDVNRTRLERETIRTYKVEYDIHKEGMDSLLSELKNCDSPKAIQEHLLATYPDMYKTLCGHAFGDDGFEIVGHDPANNLQDWLRGGLCSEEIPRSTEELFNADPHGMSNTERSNLYQEWSEQVREPLVAKVIQRHEEYIGSRARYDQAWETIHSRCLQDANVVGATTTGLARNLALLSKIQAKVLICEEAGEVLEAHLLTSLLPSVEHAILIGDHEQLRPQIANYDLQSSNPHGGAQYSLDVSLFERLVHPPHEFDGRLPFSTLLTQRRMHPSISQLIRKTLYPSLEDGNNVEKYPEVVGMKKRLFWLHHEHNEASASATEPLGTSRSNGYEIEMTTALVSHLVRQGTYRAGDIAVITPYLGQLIRLRQRMSSLFEIAVSERDLEDLDALESEEGETPPDFTPQASKVALLDSVRVATVDNFQGEEAKVIIISLVRSNPDNNCGFLKTSNRINVLLSRAQHGMYIIGNSNTYSDVPMWSEVLELLRAGNNFGTELQLQCPRHPATTILVSNPDHFLQFSPEGGCSARCGNKLDCGHVCKSRCHSDAIHGAVDCLEMCSEPLEGCGHPCPRRCSEPCETLCKKIVENLEILLPCGHRVSSTECWKTREPLAIKCKEYVSLVIPGCGHETKILCHQYDGSPPSSCTETCGYLLDCGHTCNAACRKCRRRENGQIVAEIHESCRVVCGRKYSTCQHSCTSLCHGETPCPPCAEPCAVKCSHSSCSRLCHEPCVPCLAHDCASKCPHSRCSMPCAAPCDWVPCSKRCPKELMCGHQCPSLCGEACPDVKFCQQCCSRKIRVRIVDLILNKKYHEVDLDKDPCLFPDCGHFLTRSSMDGVMGMKANSQVLAESDSVANLGLSQGSSGDNTIVCRFCHGSLRDIARYGRLVRRTILDEMVKNFVSWSANGCGKLSKRLSNEQHCLQDLPQIDSLLGAAVSSRGIPVSTHSDARAMQLSRICRLFGQDRYVEIEKLWHEICQFRDRLSHEGRPLREVVSLVEKAARQRQATEEFHDDGPQIQINSHLNIMALLLKCESFIYSDFVSLLRKFNAKAPAFLDFSQHLSDCATLAREAQDSQNSDLEIQAYTYFTLFCAVWRALADNTSSSALATKLRDDGIVYISAARTIMDATQSTPQLDLEVSEAERVFLDDDFCGIVPNKETRVENGCMS
ncbi:hypothetical protein F4778DRAFT_791649 [Xylariomycetidae sp. FL2044]|nr:hypothetical protein F4778DRAFT_791649 [Xylariomycetidae sp. FL2044]